MTDATDCCETGVLTAARHTNNQGNIHGGVLLTFADYTLCAVGRAGSSDLAVVTVTLNSEFLRPASAGSWLLGSGTVTRRSGSLVFVSGSIADDGQVLLTFSGVGKRIRRK